MHTNRRSFMWKLGAGASAAVASTVGMAKPEAPKADSAAARLVLLEEEQALRQLHQAYVKAMDKGLPDEIIGMFAADAQVVFNGGIFSNRSGVSRLYREYFPARKTGGSMEPAPGFELAAEQHRDSVEVSADRLTATADFTYSIKVGAPIETETSHAAMARLQGEGVRTWWEGGVYKVSYRKEAGSWKICRLEYHTLSRADWRPGRSYALPMAVERLSTRFPQDPQGPDVLVQG